MGALWAALRDLVVSPARFFSGMAVTGGLHEPVAFFVVLLCALVVVCLPLALCVAALGDGGGRLAAVQGAALGFALLPFLLPAGSGLMVVLGTLFHLPARLLARPRWEGAVAVWMYSVGAALGVLAAACAVALAFSLPAAVLAALRPGLAAAADRVVQWALVAAGGVGLMAALAVLVTDLCVGCMHALPCDAAVGAAAGLAGLVVAAAPVGLPLLIGLRYGAGAALLALGLCGVAAGVLTGLCVARARATAPEVAP
jgi:hypothetical protein